MRMDRGYTLFALYNNVKRVFYNTLINHLKSYQSLMSQNQKVIFLTRQSYYKKRMEEAKFDHKIKMIATANSLRSQIATLKKDSNVHI